MRQRLYMKNHCRPGEPSSFDGPVCDREVSAP
jgi:hypothetical protein